MLPLLQHVKMRRFNKKKEEGAWRHVEKIEMGSRGKVSKKMQIYLYKAQRVLGLQAGKLLLLAYFKTL